MVDEGGKCFYATAVTAAGVSLTPTAYHMPPGNWHIYRLRVGFANIVNAKESSGYVKIVPAGESGNYEYVVGQGAGGATNTGGMQAETIDCDINAKGGAKLEVYAYSAETTADWHVSIMFRAGLGRNVQTYKCGGAGTDVTAGTEKDIGTMTIDQGAGVIKEIRFAGSGVVDALAETARLRLIVPGKEGMPHEWTVGHGQAGATLSTTEHTDVIKLKHGISVGQNAVVTAKILNFVTTGSALLSCWVSIQVV